MISAREAQRLQALADYDVLDTAPEAAFDRLTRLAADLFDAPIALVSLIDSERQWFKSRVGLSAQSTPRSWAFCAHAIELGAGGILVVEDATLDSRFEANPLVTSAPNIRFYAGAALTGSDGFNLGTLCVIDTKPRPRPSADALQRLQSLAYLVVGELELRRATRVAAKNARELNLAMSALSESEAKYRALAENTSDIIVRVDLTGRLLYVSAACRAWGYEPEELVGQMGDDLVHPDDLARFSANVAEVFSGAPPDPTADREVRYRRKDGGWVWLEGNPQLIRDRAGAPVELLNVFRDVTERRRLRRIEVERTGFERLANEVAGVGYWQLDVTSRKSIWSDQMYLIHGLTPGGPPPLALAMAMSHPDDRCESDERLRDALETGEGWANVLTRIIRPDGEIRHIESRGICERDEAGAVETVFGTMADVTDRVQAEIAVAEANAERNATIELFENAFHHAAIGKALVGLDGRFLKVNDALCAIVGYPEAQLLGLDFQTITHPDDLDTDLEQLAQLCAGEIPSYQMDKRYLRGDGDQVWVRLTVSLVAESNGHPRHFISQIEDLTARKNAESKLALSEQRFRRLADNAPDIITESTLDGVLTYVSPACLAITGFAQEELIGRTSLTLMHPEDAPAVLDMCRAVFDSKGTLAPWPVEFRTRHKAGHEIWLECKPTLCLDPHTGRFTGLNDVLRDITRRKMLEVELRLAQSESEAAAAVKGEFLANMSHELRTPLTSIIGFTGLAAEQADLSDLTRTYIERVGEASRALLCSVNDILDFSKLEAGQVSFQPEPTALTKLGRGALELFTPQAGARDLSLSFDGEDDAVDLVVRVDPDRIRQILLNLVGNAVKFTTAGGVTLRTRYDRTTERLAVEVIDTGPGIAPDKLDGLFKRFSQVDGSLTRAHGGTGLGLAICKGLVEAMGGRIGVESRLGEGSRFWFEVPAALTTLQAPADDGPEIERPTFEGVRVLVVDDHPSNRELARLFLAGIGAEVTEASGGEEAAELAETWPYDVILMDLRMPGLDGVGALRRIRETGGPNDATPILAFTADVDATLAGQLLAMGFQDVVAKPLEPAALITAIARATAFAQDQQPWEETYAS